MGRPHIVAVLCCFVLSAFSAHAEGLKPCGLSGPIADRIQDCRKTNGADAVRARDWVLVTKGTGEEAEAWMESDTDLIWLPPEQGSYTWQEAREACQKKGLWLPSRVEFAKADDQGLRQVLPFLKRKLWWTFSESDFEGAAYFYNGSRGYTDDGNQTERHRVVCTIKVLRDE